MSEASLIIPGLIHVGAEDPNQPTGAQVQIGLAAGWTMPKGVHTWRRELSVVLKEDLSPALEQELGVALPERQGTQELVPRARRAAEACKLLAVEGPLVEQLIAKGLRVHTVGFDSVSNGFYYISRGGGIPPLRVLGGLIEMVAPALGETPSNTELQVALEGLIDRLLGELTEGILSEAQIELADALPPLGPKSTGGAAKLQELEGWLILAESRSSKFDAEARDLVTALRSATVRGGDVAQVPLFGEARRMAQPELDVEFVDGETGQPRRMTLPARSRWFVTGKLTPLAQAQAAQAPEVKAAAAPGAFEPRLAPGRQLPSSSDGQGAAAKKAEVESPAAQPRPARGGQPDRAAAERVAAERVAAERAAERAAAERAAAERAAAERAAAERVAAERAAAERVAAERAAAERVAAERAAAEQALAEKEAAERASAEKVAAEKAARPERAPKATAPSSALPAKKAAGPSVGFLIPLLLGVVFAVLYMLLRSR